MPLYVSTIIIEFFRFYPLLTNCKCKYTVYYILLIMITMVVLAFYLPCLLPKMLALSKLYHACLSRIYVKPFMFLTHLFGQYKLTFNRVRK